MNKIGLDVHGVIDSNPKFFGALSRTLKEAGWEVHVITGGSLKDGIIKGELKDYGIEYTHIFSIYDHLIESGVKTNEELGIASRWPFADEAWNTVKAWYCGEHDIDMHIDDMQEYLMYFTTPFMFYKDKNRNHRGQFGTHK